MKLLITLLFISLCSSAKYIAEIDNIVSANQKIEAETLKDLRDSLKEYFKHPKKKALTWNKVDNFNYQAFKGAEKVIEIEIKDISQEISQREAERQAEKNKKMQLKQKVKDAIRDNKNISNKDLKEIIHLLIKDRFGDDS